MAAMVRRSLIALVAAEVISARGTLMTVVALPWFVLETTGSPQRMTVVLAAEAAPLALLALVSGRIATRLGARRTMLVCDALWAPATAAIPLLHAAGALSFGLLVALAFVCGIPAGAHFGAQSAIVPELLGEETAGVARVNALFQTASRLTYFAGPAVGGVLLAAAGAPFVMLADAATFAGVLLGAWGGGAMLGGLVAFRIVDARDPLRLGALAWALQAAPLWLLAAGPSPAVAVAALALSGVGNGIRVPPLFGVMTIRIPAPVRAGTMTVSYSFVFASGFLALLAAGPLLDRAGAAPVFAAVATAQTLAALVVGRVALRGAPPPVALAQRST